MGFLFAVTARLFYGLMKLAGLTPQTLETEPGTLMNIWVPQETITKDVNGYVPPRKPAVLLVHCFAMEGIVVWFPQVLALTRNYSVYVPDLLFFGGSTTDKPERSVRFQAEFLAKGMEILKVDKLTLVGLSYGGIVGFEMAKLYPKLVQSMVVSAAVVELTETISQGSLKQLDVSSWSDLLLPDTIQGFKKMMIAGAHKLPWIPNFIYNGIFETMFKNRKERSQLLAAMIVPNKDAVMETNYSQRIHMVWGAEDKLFGPEIANTMKRQLGPKTTLEYIKNAGHLLSMEQPFAYNRSLKHFLANQTISARD